jgi:hypothetical protein
MLHSASLFWVVFLTVWIAMAGGLMLPAMAKPHPPKHFSQNQPVGALTVSPTQRLALEQLFGTSTANLPPGIQKRVARGKGLPPGIARQMAPGSVLTPTFRRQLSPLSAVLAEGILRILGIGTAQAANVGMGRYGRHVVLYQPETGRVWQVLEDLAP